MKKILSFVLVLAMVLSMGLTVFAAENDGSITITNATIGETYRLFKIFDATYTVDENGNAVSYTISSGNKFFDDMFGDGTQANDYFNYIAETGVVTKKATATDSAVINYLKTLIATATADAEIKATETTVKFENIGTGYFLIDRGISSTVTITSNTPDVNVIDKNQKPNVDNGFNKLIWDETSKTWVENSSANVGDEIQWQINFTATNYDVDKLVQYYSIRDTKDSSLWVEFNEITVTVNGEPVNNGYYFCANNAIATNEWDYLGTWNKQKAPENADWYLIHYGYDDFEVVIPWLTKHTFTGKQDMTKGYDLAFDLDKLNNDDSVSKYPSPAEVLVNYSAYVGPGAVNNPANNSAVLKWYTTDGPNGPEDPQTTETKTYNLGVTKVANDGDESTAATRLAGAVFGLYSDAGCTAPIYVIPTNNDGVYILDDYGLNDDNDDRNRPSARNIYALYLDAYLNGATQKNEMTTPANGQIVVLGLEAGTYYLKEIKAPEGYNQLAAPEMIVVGPASGTNPVDYSNGYTNVDGTAVVYPAYSATVVNNRGVELPSTGGEGTMMLIGFGTFVAILFSVFLITHKKMTAYID